MALNMTLLLMKRLLFAKRRCEQPVTEAFRIEEV
jgi:hypothetical protein